MSSPNRLVIAGYLTAGVPALALYILSALGIWEGGHDVPTIIALQALGLCMVISALLLSIASFRALVILRSPSGGHNPTNVAWAGLGLLGLVAVVWFGWRFYIA